ncbi:hypothetical protein [Amycolatopsis sp.]|uniref:hypothetical protein n=1 Tax=Amycolatopsis sp. TaxID=37632 RepID=UPI002E0880F3|nr:hypothetical protein [Amycolatopsis sp.]
MARDGRVGGQAGAEDLDLVIGRAALAVQLELVGVLGGTAFGRGGELGAEPVDYLGVLGRCLVLGVGGVAADPVELGLVLGAQRRHPRCLVRPARCGGPRRGRGTATTESPNAIRSRSSRRPQRRERSTDWAGAAAS